MEAEYVNMQNGNEKASGVPALTANFTLHMCRYPIMNRRFQALGTHKGAPEGAKLCNIKSTPTLTLTPRLMYENCNVLLNKH